MNIPQIVEGSFTGNGNSAYLKPDGDMILVLTGPFSANIKLGIANPPVGAASPSFTTLNQDENGNDIVFTAPVSTRIRSAGARGMLWRLECSGYVSGTIGYKLVAG